MVNSTPLQRQLRLLFFISMSGLTACGGGGGGGSSTTTYTVTATTGANGVISPASASVSEGSTTSFTVTPDTGYEIDTVSGCSGLLSGTIYTTGAVTADCTVTTSFKLVTLSASDVSVMEGDTGPRTLTFTVELSAPANGNVSVDYTISDGTATIANSDYSPGTSTGTLPISAGTTSKTLNITVFGDTTAEPNENFVLTLSNASANVSLGNATAYGIIADDDSWRGPINDTGATACFDGGATTGSCPNASYPGQDAEYGRDASAMTNTTTDGRVGFSFTKLDSTGTPLPDQTQPYATTPWVCVLDNNTNLMWEVKTTSGAHGNSNTYYWYNSNAAENGGTAGTVGTSGNDTETFVSTVNSAAFCGYSDWRLPTIDELRTIVDHGDTTTPIVDTAYFPNAVGNYHLTSTSDAEDSTLYRTLSFISGVTSWSSKNGLCCVARLVRGGQ
jgi:hypothetical protein